MSDNLSQGETTNKQSLMREAASFAGRRKARNPQERTSERRAPYLLADVLLLISCRGFIVSSLAGRPVLRLRTRFLAVRLPIARAISGINCNYCCEQVCHPFLLVMLLFSSTTGWLAASPMSQLLAPPRALCSETGAIASVATAYQYSRIPFTSPGVAHPNFRLISL